jgi:hypothetical protein
LSGRPVGNWLLFFFLKIFFCPFFNARFLFLRATNVVSFDKVILDDVLPRLLAAKVANKNANTLLAFLPTFLRSLHPDMKNRSRSLAASALRFALRHSMALDKGVRLRCAQFALDVLHAFHGAPVDPALSEYVVEMVAGLLEDRAAPVREVAAAALAQLAPTTAVIKALGDALEDSVQNVRLEVLRALAAMGDWKPLARAVSLCASDDESADVRKQALVTLAHAPDSAKWLKVAQLRQVITRGLKDQDSNVRKAATVLVLKNWFSHFDNNPEVLVQRIVDERDTQEAEAVVRALSEGGMKLSAEYFRSRIDNLSPLAALLWRVYVEAQTEEDARELVLPELEIFCNILKHYEKQPDQFCELCRLLPMYDLSGQEHARSTLSDTLRDVARFVVDLDDEENEPLSPDDDERVRVAALEALKLVHVDPADWVQVCLELIEDLRDDEHWPAALILTIGLLQYPRLSLQIPGVVALMMNVITPALACSDSHVRCLAVRAMGLFCSLSLESCVTYSILFVTILNRDTPECAMEAAKVLFDHCLIYGAALEPRLAPEVREALKQGPQCAGEPHPILARLLGPIDDATSARDMYEVACIGLAKLLFTNRVLSYRLLGRALGEAAKGQPLLRMFAELYPEQQKSKKSVILPMLRKAMETAVHSIRGQSQGKELKRLSSSWNVAYDALAAQALSAGGDPIALQYLCPSGGEASEALKEALILRARNETDPTVTEVLIRWCKDRKVVLPFSPIEKAQKTPKRTAGRRRRPAAITPAADSGLEIEIIETPSTMQRRERRSANLSESVVTPAYELERMQLLVHDIDSFPLFTEDEGAGSNRGKRASNAASIGISESTPTFVTPAKRMAVAPSVAAPPSTGLESDERARQMQMQVRALEDENRRLREQLMQQSDVGMSAPPPPSSRAGTGFAPAQKRFREDGNSSINNYNHNSERISIIVPESKQVDPNVTPARFGRVSDAYQTPDTRGKLRGAVGYVMASGVSQAEKNAIFENVAALGGTPHPSSTFSNAVTHLVWRGKPSSKVLAAALRGCWLVSPEFVYESARAGKWLDESRYGHRIDPSKNFLRGRTVAITPEFADACGRPDSGIDISLESLETVLFRVADAVKVPVAAHAEVMLCIAKSKVLYANAFPKATTMTWDDLTSMLLDIEK